MDTQDDRKQFLWHWWREALVDGAEVRSHVGSLFHADLCGRADSFEEGEEFIRWAVEPAVMWFVEDCLVGNQH